MTVRIIIGAARPEATFAEVERWACAGDVLRVIAACKDRAA